ncbi:MAG: ATP-binding cassette domain-containing protein [Chloroflexota bacterium]|nr:ATP-binding cassette domain-containing protein [Chloroflexota bacterium]
MPAAIELRGVRKRFRIRHEAARTWQGMALALLGRRRIEHEEFWALDGVDLEIAEGETLGIIGPNGSGKTTILKLLARTIEPTAGDVEARGKVFGLLELGAGMHPDLTGRENIFLNGSFLGIERNEMRHLYDRIVAFAELERFIDTPVRHYSSGMFMRLGFSIAINVDPDILLIDEVLAVGDARFTAKCYEALAEIKARGRTLVFVSHDPIQVRRFCDRVLWIDRGKIQALGDPRDVIQQYLQHMRGDAASTAAERKEAAPDLGGDQLRIRAATATDEATGAESYAFLPGGVVRLQLELESDAYLDDVTVGCAVRRSDGLLMHETSTDASLGPSAIQPGRTHVECSLGPLPLGPGSYQLSLGVWPNEDRLHPYHIWPDAITLFVGKAAASQRGVAVLPSQWRVALAPPDGELQPTSAPIAQPDMLTDAAGPFWTAPPEELAMGAREAEWLGEGWFPAENWPPRVRWTSERAVAYLRQDVGQGSLVLSACRPLHGRAQAEGRVRLNGLHIATFQLHGMDFEDVVVPLDPVTRPTTHELAIEVDDALVPAKVGLDTDTRPLGIAVSSIRVE